jgi:hypothetical protein
MKFPAYDAGYIDKCMSRPRRILNNEDGFCGSKPVDLVSAQSEYDCGYDDGYPFGGPGEMLRARMLREGK